MVGPIEASERCCRRLCLAGSCCAAVDLGAGRLCIAAEEATLGLARNEIVGVRQRGLRHATETLAVVGLALLLVSGDVEGDEEDQVRSKNADSRESGEFLACALAMVGHPLEVGGSEVCVRGKVDEAYAGQVSDRTGADTEEEGILANTYQGR